MKVYFLRHGETEWNREKRIQGSTDWTDLTGKGIREAESARDGLLSRGFTFDRMYSSPYRRAIHTAQIIGKGIGLEPIVDNRLREISFGPYEGTQYGEGLFVDDNIRFCFMDPPRYMARGGGESFDAVASRVKDFFESELAPLAEDPAHVLVVAHGGILRTVMRLATSAPLADFWEGVQPNCCMHIVDFSGGEISLDVRAMVPGAEHNNTI